MNANYKIPVDFSRLFESNIRNLSIQSEKDSIRQNLELILSTSPGEHKYDRQFGCKIWSLDFERAESRGVWKERFIRFISEAVSKYESRICDVETNVGFTDTKRDELLMKAVFIKTKANIRIDAKLVSTGEKFTFFHSFFLGPLNPD